MKMCTEAFEAWLSLFNENAADAWTVERKELRNAAMLLSVLDLELKEIRKAVSDEYYMWQKRLNSIEDFKGSSQNNRSSSQPKKSISQVQKENRKPEDYNPLVGIEPLRSLNNQNQALLNTDVFLKSSGGSEVELKQYIDSSPQQEKKIIEETSTSPKINKSRKFSRLKRPRDISNSYSLLDVTKTPKITAEMVVCDSFTSTPDKTCKENTDEVEITIIDVTPEPPHETKRIRHSKVGNLLNQKKKLKGQKNNKVTSNSTLTQMFSNVVASTKNKEIIKKDDDVDLTYCPIINIDSCRKYGEQKQDSGLDNVSKKDGGDTDLTYCPTSNINLMTVKNNKEQPIDSVTKACLPKFQDEGNLNCNIPTKDTLQQQTPCKSKIPFKFKMKPVRGKERLKLEGWDCEECKKFYEGIGENFDAKNLMNKCSRHRSKFKPEDYTVPGFWDLNFTPTQHTEKNDSTIFHF